MERRCCIPSNSAPSTLNTLVFKMLATLSATLAEGTPASTNIQGCGRNCNAAICLRAMGLYCSGLCLCWGCLRPIVTPEVCKQMVRSGRVRGAKLAWQAPLVCGVVVEVCFAR